MFKIHRKAKAMPGFAMTFENGWTVSVMFGVGNYCSNRQLTFGHGAIAPAECKNAEIAAWDADGKWHDFGDNTVKGWVSADEVADFIQMIKSKKEN